MPVLRSALTHMGVVASLVIVTCFHVGTTQAAGALAVGNCGAYGLAYDYPQPQDASAAALRQCTGDCQLATAMTRNCAALAIDGHNACGPFGYAAAPGLAQAQNTALQSCYKFGGKDCVIRAFVCDGKN